MKRLDRRRRRESKTNYTKRLLLLKGNVPRLVVRKTNKYVLLQVIESKHAQDSVVCEASTKELLRYGWPKDKSGSLKSLAAAYLTGMLLANKAKAKNVSKVILDTGLIPSTKGSRIYATVKGVVEGGLEIPHDQNILPSDEMINKYDFVEKIKGGLK
jgi:large subunit ribosomal protein L18|tara:strand:- start:788 stop:1258 length:471 start_codon:yes stop_codon:yes gene_type:complete